MANLREAQKQMTRRLLLEAGHDLFATKGYAATTVDEIAKAAGTTRVTFYSHFPSRSDLMQALLDQGLSEGLQLGADVPDLATTVAEGSRAAIRAWLLRAAQAWPSVHPLLIMGRHAAVIEPTLADPVEHWLEQGAGSIEEGLTRAGRFRPHQRRFRGVLAMAEIDYVAEHWEGAAGWGLEPREMLDDLTDAWAALLTES